MKIKVYHLDLEIPRRVKRWSLLAGVPLAMLFGIVAIAYASITKFMPGDPLSSATMNGNFSDLDKRLSALEGLVDAGADSAAPAGAIVWKDSTGAIIPIVRPLGDPTTGSAGAGPQGQFEIYDSASKAVWDFSTAGAGPGGSTVFQGVVAAWSGSGCTGTQYAFYPPPSRYAFKDSSGTQPGYYIVPDNVASATVTILSLNAGGGCASVGEVIYGVPWSSLTAVTQPTKAPGVPPYHPEPL
jgi:hypothetical protein